LGSFQANGCIFAVYATDIPLFISVLSNKYRPNFKGFPTTKAQTEKGHGNYSFLIDYAYQ